MQKYLEDWNKNKEYVELLKLMGRLSNLFSDSDIPFIHYRVTENLFCKCFGADNLSRSDTAYDAKIGKFGVGIKTFQLGQAGQSLEKIAEFNRLSDELRVLDGKNLAVKISELRNERIELANSLYETDDRFYHVIGRSKGVLSIFNSDYSKVDIDKIADVKTKKGKGVSFNDGKDEYTYSHSKSVLYKQFKITEDKLIIPVEIIADPYELLKEFIGRKKTDYRGVDYVILPLYSERKGGYVPENSGLNQWNGSGRRRNDDEAYIPVPKMIHNNFPEFFPARGVSFKLVLPNNKELDVALCQEGGKSIMSNPNSALGEWLLRDVMKMKRGELVTMNKLNALGFDSVKITKISELRYKIDVSNLQNRYSDFILQE